jgi:hypothetical protein
LPRKLPADILERLRYNRNINENSDVNELAEEINAMPNTQTTAISAADNNSVDMLLQELNLDVAIAGDDDVVNEVIVEELPLAELSEEDLLKATAALDREEAYASQSSEADTHDPTAVPAAPAKAPRKARAASTSTPKAPATPRAPRDLSSLSDEHFVLEGDPATLDAATLTANRAAVMATVPTQVKVAEKFENVLTSIAAGKKPSTYVVDAFAILDAKKAVTSMDLVAAFKADGYNEGTARSQVGQIMNLFATLKIANRSNSNLTLNPASRLAERLRNIISGATV